jgi:hypothetical protein
MKIQTILSHKHLATTTNGLQIVSTSLNDNNSHDHYVLCSNVAVNKRKEHHFCGH